MTKKKEFHIVKWRRIVTFALTTKHLPKMTQRPFIIRHIVDNPIDTSLIPHILDEAQVAFVPVAQHGWPDQFPYFPQMEVRLAHTGTHLLVDYRVTETSVRAMAPHDNGNVWEDSCCELFIAFITGSQANAETGNNTFYYNIECNAAGTLLMGYGQGRTHRLRADQSILNMVGRWSSMGSAPFDNLDGERTWCLCLDIPACAFFRDNIRSLNGLHASGNIYKCGDKLPRPHFLSLYPINTPKPDFHRPDCFGTIVFE